MLCTLSFGGFNLWILIPFGNLKMRFFFSFLIYFGHRMGRTDSLEKTLMLGGVEDRRRRGWEDEMVGGHHQLNGQEFTWTLGDPGEQGSLACCSPQGCEESDMTEWVMSARHEQQHIEEHAWQYCAGFFMHQHESATGSYVTSGPLFCIW